MSRRYRLEPLGTALALTRDEVAVDPTETYRIAGMYSFGRGIFERPGLLGAEMRYRSLFRLHENHVVMSRLNAWEGAVAVVDGPIAGAFVSNEYPTFEIDREVADVRYIAHICRWPTFWDSLRDRAKGMGSSVGARRLRVHPEQLLAVEVPLPDLNEQRRIAGLLDTGIASADTVEAVTETGARTDEVLIERAIDELLRHLVETGWVQRPLGELVEVNPRPAPDDDVNVAFVPMAAVEEATGSISSVDLRPRTDVRSGYKQFRVGDVLFARITPCMQNGKAAVVSELPSTFGYGSTEFHVLRPSNSVSADWIHRIVRSRSFREDAASHFKGTAGQQRVPASFFELVPIPVPPSQQDESEALRRIDDLAMRLSELRALRRHASILAGAYRLSLFNSAFAGVM